LVRPIYFLLFDIFFIFILFYYPFKFKFNNIIFELQCFKQSKTFVVLTMDSSSGQCNQETDTSLYNEEDSLDPRIQVMIGFIVSYTDKI